MFHDRPVFTLLFIHHAIKLNTDSVFLQNDLLSTETVSCLENSAWNSAEWLLLSTKD